MQQLIKIAESAIQNKKSNATANITTIGAPASQRVPLHTNNDTRKTRSMKPPNAQVPQLYTPSVPRVDQSTKTKHKHQTKKHKTKFTTTAPAHNTRSQTQATVPACRRRARTQLTKIKNKTQTGHASTVYADIAQMENDVNQALLVIDTDTGKLLSYIQLMINLNFKKNGARPQQINSDGQQMGSADE